MTMTAITHQRPTMRCAPGQGKTHTISMILTPTPGETISEKLANWFMGRGKPRSTSSRAWVLTTAPPSLMERGDPCVGQSHSAQRLYGEELRKASQVRRLTDDAVPLCPSESHPAQVSPLAGTPLTPLCWSSGYTPALKTPSLPLDAAEASWHLKKTFLMFKENKT